MLDGEMACATNGLLSKVPVSRIFSAHTYFSIIAGSSRTSEYKSGKANKSLIWSTFELHKAGTNIHRGLKSSYSRSERALRASSVWLSCRKCWIWDSLYLVWFERERESLGRRWLMIMSFFCCLDLYGFEFLLFSSGDEWGREIESGWDLYIVFVYGCWTIERLREIDKMSNACCVVRYPIPL